ncbi:MAG: heavy-metal-associated domain-containing protein [Bacteroidetes bacterium]|nr:heavy-metal-associated domain-containing protein [Bacteroidota bacterium]
MVCTLGIAQVNKQYLGNKKKTLVIKTKFYASHCLNCDSCKTLIINSIMELKGIQTAEVDFIKKIISVVYNGKFTDEKSILAKVNKAGYRANSSKANLEQRKQLLHACKP